MYKNYRLNSKLLPANSGNRWYSIPVLANHSSCIVCMFKAEWLLFKTPSKEWWVGTGLAGDVAEPSEDGGHPPPLFGPNPCGGGTEKILGYPWYIAGCEGNKADGGTRGEALGRPCMPLMKGELEVVIEGPRVADEEGLWGDEGGDTGAPPGGEKEDLFPSISDETTTFNASAVAGFNRDSMQKDLCIICLWSLTLRAVVSMLSFFSPLICGNIFNDDVGEIHIDGSGDSLLIGDLARVDLIGEELSWGLISESIFVRYIDLIILITIIKSYKLWDESDYLLNTLNVIWRAITKNRRDLYTKLYLADIVFITLVKSFHGDKLSWNVVQVI